MSSSPTGIELRNSGSDRRDDEWQQQRPRGQRGGSSPAHKSSEPSKTVEVPASYAQGAKKWVEKHYKGSSMKAHLDGWTDSSRKTSRVLLRGADAEKCAGLLRAKVKKWSEQSKSSGGPKGTYTAAGARTVFSLPGRTAKDALFKAKSGTPVVFHPVKKQADDGLTFQYTLSGGSAADRSAVQTLAASLAVQMSRTIELPASCAGAAISRTAKDYQEQMGYKVDIGRFRYAKGDTFHYVYVLTDDADESECVFATLRHFATEVEGENAELVRMYQTGKTVKIPWSVLKGNRWKARYATHKFLPREVPEKDRPQEGWAFVSFPDTTEGAACLKKARDLTKRHLKEAKSEGGDAKSKSKSKPKADVSAEDWYAARDRKAAQKGGGAKAPPSKKSFKSGGGFDGLEVDPERMDAVVVPKASKKAKSKGKGPRRLEVHYTVGSSPEETEADRMTEKREVELKKHLAEMSRKEIGAEFTAKATTAGPSGSAWSVTAAKAPPVEKEEHILLPPTSFEKPSRTASTESVEDWELAADDEEQRPPGGWDM